MTIERLNKCPLCKSGLFLNLTTVIDYSITKEKFVVCKCSTCNFKFTNPRPDEASIGAYYKSEAYISHSNRSNTPINFLYKLVRQVTVRQKITLIKNHLPKNPTILDYGCGTGFLLDAAQKKGWSVYGVEPNEDARKIAQQKNLTVYPSLAQLDGQIKFNGIMLFHVLEHVHELRKTFKTLKKLLKTDGLMFLALPNIDSYDASFYNNNWAAYDVPRHLYHFDQNTVAILAETYKLEIIHTIPMKFDSYYVSMLSEKNLKPTSSYFNQMLTGFRKGFVSNRWAKLNQNNYSSLLYILKKK